MDEERFYFHFKLLVGPLKGRVLELPLGEFVIGQHEDSDLFLELEPGVDRVQLNVTKATVTVVTNGVACWVDGDNWDLEKPLPMGVVVDLAGLYFVLNTIDHELSDLVIPKRKTVHAFLSKKHLQTVWKQWNRTFGLIAVLLVLLSFGSYYAFDLFNQKVKHDRIQEALDLAHQSPFLKDLTFEWQPDGSLIIDGRCKDSIQVQAFNSELQRQGIYVYQRVVCSDQILRNAKNILQMSGYPEVEVQFDAEKNELNFSGNIENNAKWHQVETYLSKIPQVKSWNITNPVETYFNKMVTLLKNNNFIFFTTLINTGKGLELYGEFTVEQHQTLKNLIELFRKKNENPPPVRIINNKFRINPVEVLGSSIMSIGGNITNPFLELENGMRLTKGMRLNTGYEIFGIDPSKGASLLKPGRLLFIPFSIS